MGIKGWDNNERGVSYIFGKDIVNKFLRKHDLDLIARAHQVVEDGYEFFAKRKLVTSSQESRQSESMELSSTLANEKSSLLERFQGGSLDVDALIERLIGNNQGYHKAYFRNGCSRNAKEYGSM